MFAQQLRSNKLRYAGAAVFCCLGLLQAEQPPQFTIQGQVVDPSGAAVAGARVAAARVTEIFASASTDRSGEFSILVPPGSYTVTVAAGGFKDAGREIVVRETRAEPVVITCKSQIGRR